MPLTPTVQAGLPVDLRTPGQSTDLICISSSLITDSKKEVKKTEISTVHVHRFPCIPGNFSGVGDLFSALLLAHYHPSLPSPQTLAQTSLSTATSHALSKTFAILQSTTAHTLTLPEDERTLSDEEADTAELDRIVRRMRGRELRLIQGQDILRGERPIDTRWMAVWDDFWN